MSHFTYRDDHLYAEGLSIDELADQYGTPLYIYSRSGLEQNWQAFHQALGNYPHLICYAVKANSNLAILKILADLGSGFDIVSQGELERVLMAGGDPTKIAFSGVGKSSVEIERALEVGIKCFNVESQPELERINAIAEKCGKIAPISLRVNPDVDGKTHPYISTGLKNNKFGIAFEQVEDICAQIQNLPHLSLKGIGCHIGSQLTDLAPIVESVERLLFLVDQLAKSGIILEHVDIGGGLGVRYKDETPPTAREYVAAILPYFQQRNIELILEPGRAIVADVGMLVTEVEYLKYTPDKNFAIVDAAMNDFLRPALYQAWQEIIPVYIRSEKPNWYDVVGPVCETGDYLGKNRALAIHQGDRLAVCSAGAYGFSMSSNYNSRGRACEVLVEHSNSYLIRERESLSSLWQLEKMLPK